MELESTMTPDCGHAASAADGTWGSNTLGGQREFSAHKDVPVVLPVRDGSLVLRDSDWGHELCPAVLPVEVRLAGHGCGSSVDQA